MNRRSEGRVLVLPLLAPAPWINSNDRLHYRRRMQYTRQWRKAAAEAAELAFGSTSGLPINELVHITVTVHKRSNRKYDAGNLYPTAKAIVDGLRDAGVLVDDDNAHVIGPDMRAGDQHAHDCVSVRVALAKPARRVTT